MDVVATLQLMIFWTVVFPLLLCWIGVFGWLGRCVEDLCDFIDWLMWAPWQIEISIVYDAEPPRNNGGNTPPNRRTRRAAERDRARSRNRSRSPLRSLPGTWPSSAANDVRPRVEDDSKRVITGSSIIAGAVVTGLFSPPRSPASSPLPSPVPTPVKPVQRAAGPHADSLRWQWGTAVDTQQRVNDEGSYSSMESTRAHLAERRAKADREVVHRLRALQLFDQKPPSTISRALEVASETITKQRSKNRHVSFALPDTADQVQAPVTQQHDLQPLSETPTKVPDLHIGEVDDGTVEREPVPAHGDMTEEAIVVDEPSLPPLPDTPELLPPPADNPNEVEPAVPAPPAACEDVEMDGVDTVNADSSGPVTAESPVCSKTSVRLQGIMDSKWAQTRSPSFAGESVDDSMDMNSSEIDVSLSETAVNDMGMEELEKIADLCSGMNGLSITCEIAMSDIQAMTTPTTPQPLSTPERLAQPIEMLVATPPLAQQYPLRKIDWTVPTPDLTGAPEKVAVASTPQTNVPASVPVRVSVPAAQSQPAAPCQPPRLALPGPHRPRQSWEPQQLAMDMETESTPAPDAEMSQDDTPADNVGVDAAAPVTVIMEDEPAHARNATAPQDDTLQAAVDLLDEFVHAEVDLVGNTGEVATAPVAIEAAVENETEMLEQPAAPIESSPVQEANLSPQKAVQEPKTKSFSPSRSFNISSTAPPAAEVARFASQQSVEDTRVLSNPESRTGSISIGPARQSGLSSSSGKVSTADNLHNLPVSRTTVISSVLREDPKKVKQLRQAQSAQARQRTTVFSLRGPTSLSRKFYLDSSNVLLQNKLISQTRKNSLIREWAQAWYDNSRYLQETTARPGGQNGWETIVENRPWSNYLQWMAQKATFIKQYGRANAESPTGSHTRDVSLLTNEKIAESGLDKLQLTHEVLCQGALMLAANHAKARLLYNARRAIESLEVMLANRPVQTTNTAYMRGDPEGLAAARAQEAPVKSAKIAEDTSRATPDTSVGQK